MWIADRRILLSPDKSQTCDAVDAAEGKCGHPHHSLLAPIGAKLTDRQCRQYGLGPHASQVEATTDTLDVSDPEPTTDTDEEKEGPQIDPQDVIIGEEPATELNQDESPTPVPAAPDKPKRKK